MKKEGTDNRNIFEQLADKAKECEDKLAAFFQGRDSVADIRKDDTLKKVIRDNQRFSK